MSKMQFKQGDKVAYNIVGIMEGEGIIKGVATNGVPILGMQYIIEDLSSHIPNKEYPYSHFVCFEAWLKKV